LLQAAVTFGSGGRMISCHSKPQEQANEHASEQAAVTFGSGEGLAAAEPAFPIVERHSAEAPPLITQG